MPAWAAALRRQAHQAHFKGVAQGVDLAQRLDGLLAEERGRYIVPARQQEAVQARKAVFQHAALHVGAEQHRRAACGDHRREIVPEDKVTRFLRVDAARYADERICRHACRRLSVVFLAQGVQDATALFLPACKRRCARHAKDAGGDSPKAAA